MGVNCSSPPCAAYHALLKEVCASLAATRGLNVEELLDAHVQHPPRGLCLGTPLPVLLQLPALLEPACHFILLSERARTTHTLCDYGAHSCDAYRRPD